MLEIVERWLPVLLVLVLGTLWWFYQQPDRAVDHLQRGINYVSYDPEEYGSPSAKEDLKYLKSFGVDWVAVVVTWYQSNPMATDIASDPLRTPTDASLTGLLRDLHALNLKVFLRPMVDSKDGMWRGSIKFDREADWSAWFASYERFILHYAKIAAQNHVSLYSVGVELEDTVRRDDTWRSVIDHVRQVFNGPLTYSANWDGFSEVPFWDALDYVGIDAYFDLVLDANAEPTQEAMKVAWQQWVDQIGQFSDENKKRILLTEIGMQSIQGGSRHPWDWSIEAPISLQEQATYYEATFKVFWDKPWLAGLYWWAVLPDPDKRGSNDDSYSPREKPAENVIKAWYKGSD